MRWKVALMGISWDDGKGEYDVSGLPKVVRVEVNADDPEQAVEYAMTDVDETYGSLIEGVNAIITTEIEEEDDYSN